VVAGEAEPVVRAGGVGEQRPERDRLCAGVLGIGDAPGAQVGVDVLVETGAAVLDEAHCGERGDGLGDGGGLEAGAGGDGAVGDDVGGAVGGGGDDLEVLDDGEGEAGDSRGD